MPVAAYPHTLTRRGLMAGGVALAGAGLAPTTETLAFKVYRNGSQIGTHELVFKRTGARLRAHIAADFRVGLGFITLFRYRHRALEEWQRGQFTTLDSTTDSNGTLFQVTARREATGVSIRALGLPDQILHKDTLPLTHWAMAAMHAPLFNPQTGKVLRETARPAGAGMVALASGKPVPATVFRLAGETPMEDWYDARQIWVALNARGPDGSHIAYRRA